MNPLCTGIVRIKITSQGGKNFKLLIPILLVLILVLPIVLLVAPFYLVAAIVMSALGNFKLLRAPYYFWQLLQATRGTEITVEEEHSSVLVQIT